MTLDVIAVDRIPKDDFRREQDSEKPLAIAGPAVSKEPLMLLVWEPALKTFYFHCPSSGEHISASARSLGVSTNANTHSGTRFGGVRPAIGIRRIQAPMETVLVLYVTAIQ